MVLCLVHDHHNIIRWLVIYHQFAIPIINSATRRIIDFLEESITIGILFEVIAEQLNREEPNDIDQHNRQSYTTYNITPIFKSIIFHLMKQYL